MYYIGAVSHSLRNSNLRSEILFIKVVKSISLYLSCVDYYITCWLKIVIQELIVVLLLPFPSNNLYGFDSLR